MNEAPEFVQLNDGIKCSIKSVPNLKVELVVVGVGVSDHKLKHIMSEASDIITHFCSPSNMVNELT